MPMHDWRPPDLTAAAAFIPKLTPSSSQWHSVSYSFPPKEFAPLNKKARPSRRLLREEPIISELWALTRRRFFFPQLGRKRRGRYRREEKTFPVLHILCSSLWRSKSSTFSYFDILMWNSATFFSQILFTRVWKHDSFEEKLFPYANPIWIELMR